ncbi:hypothetical protein [Halostella litorea]|uniref:hypothetical protein n=1 Tax=Halostella litorea TaxID=2528831 RepID=UPI0010925D5F|nr:hypothetical protein [Halostella litorea]
MTDDRAERMRQRRQQSQRSQPDGDEQTAQQAEPSQPSQPAEQSEPAETGEPDKPDEQVETAEQDEPGETGEESVKDEHEGVYVYLPKAQKKQLKHVYTAAKATYEPEYDTDFEKNRHYYPLVVEFGLERVADADAEELDEMLDELDY